MANEASAKTRQIAGKAVDLEAEEDYWRKHHASQPHAAEGTAFEQFAPAYRVGAEAAHKYPGREFHEIEDDVALDLKSTRSVRHFPGTASEERQKRLGRKSVA